MPLIEAHLKTLFQQEYSRNAPAILNFVTENKATHWNWRNVLYEERNFTESVYNHFILTRIIK